MIRLQTLMKCFGILLKNSCKSRDEIKINYNHNLIAAKIFRYLMILLKEEMIIRLVLVLCVLSFASLSDAQEKDFLWNNQNHYQQKSSQRDTNIKSSFAKYSIEKYNVIPGNTRKASKGMYIFQGFEGNIFPPPGWVKHCPDSGLGWERQIVGTSPVPGWTGGTISSAPVGGGIGVAFCTYSTGGPSFNDQWLVSPIYIDVQVGDSLTFWMYKFAEHNDNLDVKISTSGNQISDFATNIAQIVYATSDTGWHYYSYPLDAYAGSDIYIAFNEHVSNNFLDGDAFFLDNITIGAPPQNDVGAINVDIPAMIKEGTFSPEATVINFGSATQTFDVQMQITGGYYSIRTITNLATNTSQTVTFDPWNPALGAYNVNVCTQLAGDFNPSNDCVNGNIQVIDVPNTKVYCYIVGDPSGLLPEGPAYFYLQDPSVITTIADHTGQEPVYGATWGPGNKWYGISDLQLIEIDTVTGDRTVIGNATPDDPSYESWTGISFDYSTNTLYGITYNGSSSILYTINPNTGSTNLVGVSNDKLIINLACNLAGELFGVDIIANVLCSVNKSNGIATVIGPIGLNANFAQTMEFDRVNGMCYYLSYNDVLGGQLRVVDVTNGISSVIGDLLGGAEVTGLAIPYYGFVGVSEQDNDIVSYNIYPNPASDYLFVSSNKTISSLSLVNNIGQTILKVPVNGDEIKISTANLAKGVYFLRIASDNAVTMEKIVIE